MNANSVAQLASLIRSSKLELLHQCCRFYRNVIRATVTHLSLKSSEYLHLFPNVTSVFLMELKEPLPSRITTVRVSSYDDVTWTHSSSVETLFIANYYFMEELPRKRMDCILHHIRGDEVDSHDLLPNTTIHLDDIALPALTRPITHLSIPIPSVFDEIALPSILTHLHLMKGSAVERVSVEKLSPTQLKTLILDKGIGVPNKLPQSLTKLYFCPPPEYEVRLQLLHGLVTIPSQLMECYMDSPTPFSPLTITTRQSDRLQTFMTTYTVARDSTLCQSHSTEDDDRGTLYPSLLPDSARTHLPPSQERQHAIQLLQPHTVEESAPHRDQQLRYGTNGGMWSFMWIRMLNLAREHPSSHSSVSPH